MSTVVDLVLQKCEAEGCKALGMPLFLNGDSVRSGPFYFCYDHMRGAGWCPGCLIFCGGLEDFDYSSTGLCGECEQSEYWDGDWDGAY